LDFLAPRLTANLHLSSVHQFTSHSHGGTHLYELALSVAGGDECGCELVGSSRLERFKTSRVGFVHLSCTGWRPKLAQFLLNP